MSLALITADQHQTFLYPLRATLSVLVYPIQYLVSIPVEISQNGFESISTYSRAIEENRKLRNDQLVLKSQLLRFSALEKENIRLRALLETSFKLGEQVLIAELLSVNLVPYQHVVMINKGKRFSVYTGQPVVDAYGIVGQVIRANPLNSEVILVTDPNHAIPVEINRNGLRTIAVGSGQIDQLRLPYLSNSTDIVKGDLLVTSGLGGTFPQGYPVAKVTEVSPQPGQSFSRVIAEPVAHLDRSRELLLVWTNTELIPLIGTIDATDELPPNDND